MTSNQVKSVNVKNGVLISNATGKALAYALFGLQERGKLMIEANVEVTKAKSSVFTAVQMT